jgi:hypothetical protein
MSTPLTEKHNSRKTVGLHTTCWDSALIGFIDCVYSLPPVWSSGPLGIPPPRGNLDRPQVHFEKLPRIIAGWFCGTFRLETSPRNKVNLMRQVRPRSSSELS